MTPLTRTLILSGILLTVFILAAVATQTWLRRQTQLFVTPATESHQVDTTGPVPTRLHHLHQRALTGLTLLAIILLAIPWMLLVLSNRRATGEGASPLQRDAAGLQEFARLSVERGAALEQEQGARQRAEEDLLLSRSLLDRSLEERVRLGRELHDNVSQTLYAITLTLESVQKKMTATPEISERLDRSLSELRRLNREVRAYLRDLEPESLKESALAQAFSDALTTASSAGVITEAVLDGETLRLVSRDRAVDFVNIVREAISNSVRHARPRHLSVRTARAGNEIAIAIADDGAGFVLSPSVSAGHGLANMQARAASLGGRLQVESTPGKGTRVILTAPIDSDPL